MEPSRVSTRDAYALLKARSEDLARKVELPDDEYAIEVLVYDGDLRVEGDLAVGPEPVVVLGSLHVTGWLSDRKDADVTVLAVTGAVHAHRALFRSQVVIGGDLDVTTLVYANSFNDHPLDVGGDLKAAALVEEGTYCEIGGMVRAPLLLSLQNAIVQGPEQTEVVERDARPASDLFREAFLDDGYPNMDRIRAAMKANEPILR